jgi:hypothetical protein
MLIHKALYQFWYCCDLRLMMVWKSGFSYLTFRYAAFYIMVFRLFLLFYKKIHAFGVTLCNRPCACPHKFLISISRNMVLTSCSRNPFFPTMNSTNIETVRHQKHLRTLLTFCGNTVSTYIQPLSRQLIWNVKQLHEICIRISVWWQ